MNQRYDTGRPGINKIDLIHGCHTMHCCLKLQVYWSNSAIVNMKTVKIVTVNLADFIADVDRPVKL
jgi:hypothetical protein